jgi:hypothetical protein
MSKFDVLNGHFVILDGFLRYNQVDKADIYFRSIGEASYAVMQLMVARKAMVNIRAIMQTHPRTAAMRARLLKDLRTVVDARSYLVLYLNGQEPIIEGFDDMLRSTKHIMVTPQEIEEYQEVLGMNIF